MEEAGEPRTGVGQRRGNLAHLSANPRMRIWQLRAVVAVVILVAFWILVSWQLGLTLAVIAIIADTIYRARKGYRPRAKFSTWLYRIALNVAISQARRRRDDGRLEPLEAHHMESVAGEERPEPDERLQALYGFIGELDALNRALILLYLEDRSYLEIADILGISETNVATKINRIKQKLRGQMTAATTYLTRA